MKLHNLVSKTLTAFATILGAATGQACMMPPTFQEAPTHTALQPETQDSRSYQETPQLVAQSFSTLETSRARELPEHSVTTQDISEVLQQCPVALANLVQSHYDGQEQKETVPIKFCRSTRVVGHVSADISGMLSYAHYDPVQNTIVLPTPDGNMITREKMQDAIFHELGHAMLDVMLSSPNYTGPQRRELNNALDQLRSRPDLVLRSKYQEEMKKANRLDYEYEFECDAWGKLKRHVDYLDMYILPLPQQTLRDYDAARFEPFMTEVRAHNLSFRDEFYRIYNKAGFGRASDRRIDLAHELLEFDDQLFGIVNCNNCNHDYHQFARYCRKNVFRDQRNVLKVLGKNFWHVFRHTHLGWRSIRTRVPASEQHAYRERVRLFSELVKIDPQAFMPHIDARIVHAITTMNNTFNVDTQLLSSHYREAYGLAKAAEDIEKAVYPFVYEASAPDHFWVLKRKDDGMWMSYFSSLQPPEERRRYLSGKTVADIDQEREGKLMKLIAHDLTHIRDTVDKTLCQLHGQDAQLNEFFAESIHSLLTLYVGENDSILRRDPHLFVVPEILLSQFENMQFNHSLFMAPYVARYRLALERVASGEDPGEVRAKLRSCPSFTYQDVHYVLPHTQFSITGEIPFLEKE